MIILCLPEFLIVTIYDEVCSATEYSVLYLFFVSHIHDVPTDDIEESFLCQPPLHHGMLYKK